jgi:ADP-ribosylglycohydrolase
MAHMRLPGNLEERLVRVVCSLEGLSVGDAFGEQLFHQPDGSDNRITTQALPSLPWSYTDDTQMAQCTIATICHVAIGKRTMTLKQRFAKR